MPLEPDASANKINGWLAGAAEAVASVRYCWLSTLFDDGAFNSRPMGRLPAEEGDDAWTIRFLTDGRSHKATQIRRGAKGAVMFQHEASDAYVKATGPIMLEEGLPVVAARWKRDYENYFPTQRDRENAAFIELRTARLELWIRGVTPGPFGQFSTVLERTQSGGWRQVLVDQREESGT